MARTPESMPSDRTMATIPRRRPRVLIAVLLVWAVAATVGFAATRWAKSPSQVAAESQPPALTLLTEPVAFREISQTVTARGSVAPTWTREASPGSAAGAALVVVTKRPVPLGPVKAGAVLVEVSGRPVLLLRGQFPMYRDLVRGLSGPDVKQLQSALKELGLYWRTLNGKFDGPTEVAVKRLYVRAGYQPVAAGAADTIVEAASPAEAKSPAPVSTGTIQLPRSEIMFVPSLPAVLSSVGVRVGEVVNGDKPLVTVRSTGLSLTARLNPADGNDSVIGAAVVMKLPDGRSVGHGVVSRLGAVTTDSQTGERYVPTFISPSKSLPMRLAGTDLTLSIAVQSSKGKVLVVPLTAVYSDAQGATTVDLVSTAGEVEAVTVDVGLIADGYVAIESTSRKVQLLGHMVAVGRASNG